jgi:hypothetical protein
MCVSYERQSPCTQTEFYNRACDLAESGRELGSRCGHHDNVGMDRDTQAKRIREIKVMGIGIIDINSPREKETDSV